MASKAVTPKREKLNTIKSYLEKSKGHIADVLPKHMSPEKMVRICSAAASRNPLLLECSPLSFVSAVITASQLGLEPVGPLQEAYLIPYKNGKTGEYEAQFQAGYRGLIKLARNSGEIAGIEAHIVYEADEFEVSYGTDSYIKHIPVMTDDPGKRVAVYAVAYFKDPSVRPQFEVLTPKQVEHIRQKSMAKNNGPWQTDTDEMWRKTAVKRLCKYLPLSAELATAIELDNKAEIGESQRDVIDIDLTEVEPEEAPVKSEQIAEKLNNDKPNKDEIFADIEDEGK
jgi:recombination protein RecT